MKRKIREIEGWSSGWNKTRSYDVKGQWNVENIRIIEELPINIDTLKTNCIKTETQEAPHEVTI